VKTPTLKVSIHEEKDNGHTWFKIEVQQQKHGLTIKVHTQDLMFNANICTWSKHVLYRM
jgi:hypothetical protein